MAFPTHFRYLATLPVYPINPTFVDVFNRIPPVQDSLLSHLNIKDILILRRVTKRLEDPFKITLATQFNINSRLKLFVDDPNGFRNQQARSGALISGNLLDDFFTRGTKNLERRRGPYLNIVVQKNYAKGMSDYLSSAGYTEHEDYFNENLTEDVAKVTYLVRNRHTNEPSREISLVETLSPPLYVVLCDSTTTCSQNFMTWEKAYSLFPFTNFIKREGYVLDSSLWRERAARSSVLRLCKLQGFTMQSARTQLFEEEARWNPSVPASLGPSVRHVGDKYTWSISLNTANLQAPDDATMRTFLTESAEFDIKFEHSIGLIGGFRIDCQVLDSFSLEYSYITRDNQNLQARYDDLDVMGVAMLEPEDRPRNFGPLFDRDMDIDWSILEGWDPPSYWVYYDEEVIEGLKKRFPELKNLL